MITLVMVSILPTINNASNCLPSGIVPSNHATFKSMLLTFKSWNGARMVPEYLSEILQPYQPSRSLRSGNLHLLHVPRSKTVTYGDRRFGAAAPKQWNDLPLKIRDAKTIDSFKSNLKTHLFKKAFP